MAKKKNLYVETWRKHVEQINKIIEEGRDWIQLDSNDFTAYGNRKDYSFTLKIENCVFSENKGSAVARDLKIILDENSDFQNLAKGKAIKIRLSSNFRLSIEIE